MKFKVYGSQQISVCITVEAENAEDAIEKAYEEFDGLTGCVGNGGSDKLIGTTQREVSLDADGEVEFNDAESQ